MKRPIIKIAAAAVIVIAVLIAMNQLVGSAGSVAWGEVVQNIEASPGFIFQLKQIYHRETGTIEINSKVYGSAKYGMRMDGYLDSEVTIQTYATLSDGAMTSVDHPNRTYYRTALADDALAELENMEPKEAVREYSKYAEALKPKFLDIMESLKDFQPTVGNSKDDKTNC